MEVGPRSSTTISVLIVDDEPIARQRVRRLLLRDPDVRIVGECATAADCLRVAATVAPDLIFLDVRMPEQNGFDLLKALDARGRMPLIIFVTAFSDYAVGAFDVEAIDYVLKPFDDERLGKAIARAKQVIALQRAAPDSTATGRRLPEVGSRVRDRLLVTENGRVLFVPTAEIEMIEAAGKHVKIHVQGRCYAIRQPLREIEARLDSTQFVRIHRSTIINVEQIVELQPLFHGDYEIVLRRGTRTTMSRRFRSRMQPFMAGPWPG